MVALPVEIDFCIYQSSQEVEGCEPNIPKPIVMNVIKKWRDDQRGDNNSDRLVKKGLG